MSPRKENFEDTFQFLACYFNQDFSDEFSEPEQAIRQYVDDSDARIRSSVVMQLRRILADYADDDLDAVILELGCYYSPQRHRGTTMRKWVEQVLAQLESSLETPKPAGSK